jgi:lysophospholipase L1-like esterase
MVEMRHAAILPQVRPRRGVGAYEMRLLLRFLLPLAACAALVPATAAHAASYVALGDSYTAGPGIPLPIQPWGCLKSDHNYAHLAAPDLALELRDPSCSGAETEDMTQTQGVWPEPNPPQFGALGADTTLATLGIGGNDIGFSGLAEDCFSERNEGTPCKDQYTAGGTDEVSRRIAETAPKVAAVLQGIRDRAPSARTLVVNYPAIFPHTGPGCHPEIPVTDGDAAWLREKQQELNAMLADQAAAAGAGLVDWYTASIGHDACKPPGIKWVEGPAPNSGVAPLHPNLLGMLAASDLVVAAAG